MGHGTYSHAYAGHGSLLRTAPPVAAGDVAGTGRFGRLLPNLDPLRVQPEQLRELAGQMLESTGGKTQNGGMDNDKIPVAYIYLGQFIDHNITFDATTISEARVDPSSLINYRSPRFDLDSVYGGGPGVQPHLYQREDPDLLEIGGAQKFRIVDGKVVPDIGIMADLPRAWNRFALIADPRNDENLIVAQLHVAFLWFHNRIVEAIRTQQIPRRAPLRKTVFLEARDLAIRHYQWMILHDFLPRIVGRKVILRLLRESSMMARQGRLYIPVEFSAAAYRFGHTALRPVYNLNGSTDPATIIDLFNFSGRVGSDARVPIPDTWIVEWYRLLHMDPLHSENTLSRRIDPYLADDLAKMPVLSGAPDSLPTMNLLRGNMLGLPAGQSVAGFFGYKPLTPEEIAQGDDGQVAQKYQMDRDTPLWYYILKEAMVRRGGERLGPVGARLVAEVFIGLLQLDENSILNRARRWRPILGKTPGKFTLVDLLRFAKVMNEDGPGLGPGLETPIGRIVDPKCYSQNATPAAVNPNA